MSSPSFRGDGATGKEQIGSEPVCVWQVSTGSHCGWKKASGMTCAMPSASASACRAAGWGTVGWFISKLTDLMLSQIVDVWTSLCLREQSCLSCVA